MKFIKTRGAAMISLPPSLFELWRQAAQRTCALHGPNIAPDEMIRDMFDDLRGDVEVTRIEIKLVLAS